LEASERQLVLRLKALEEQFRGLHREPQAQEHFDQETLAERPWLKMWLWLKLRLY
jgi:hypothetical protein